MVYKLADNIISPLGLSTTENYWAVKSGKSALRSHHNAFGLPEEFIGSMIDFRQIQQLWDTTHANKDQQKLTAEGLTGSGVAVNQPFTRFEQLCILSILSCVPVRFLRDNSKMIKLFLSSTKGNVDLLQNNLYDEGYYLGRSATKISTYLGLKQPPIVVSNACISGVCAQIAAYRALEAGRCDYAIVVGCDLLSKFVISGFQSFKALSDTPCKPFDKERNGLNLGEAVGTILLGRESHSFSGVGELAPDGNIAQSAWQIAATSNHNDANHISGPSRTGEGAFRVLSDLMRVADKEQLAFINLHGTATPYNDEMESIAIHRAGLDSVAVNGFKGYYGHTLGAAGVIESILSMAAVDDSCIPATLGFRESGTSFPLNLSAENRFTNRKSFIKILSGFGGSNAGILWRKGGVDANA